MSDTARCAAAHPEDPTPCDGPPVVTVLDAKNAGADGCEHHGARLLASLEGGRVYALPDAPDGAAIRVFKAAQGIRPFAWVTDAPRTEPSQLSHEENRALAAEPDADAPRDPMELKERMDAEAAEFMGDDLNDALWDGRGIQLTDDGAKAGGDDWS
jgi:hypothetical protein